MANTSSAKKASKQNEKRRVRNLARRTSIKTAIKKVLASLEGKTLDIHQSQELLKDVAARLARAKSKGVMHANTAARKLGRLAKKINAATHAGA